MLADTMLSVGQPLSVPVHSNQLGAVDEVCNAALGCGQSDVIGQLLPLVVTGLAVMVVLAAAYHVREARAAVAEERSRTATERQAFQRFAREVDRIDPSPAAVQLSTAPAVTTAVAASSPRPDRGLEQVRQAYQETLLAMDHYDEEYDEPLAQHMRLELGEEVATAVEQSQQLTPPLKQALVSRANEAARERERLINRLAGEQEGLETADEELSAVAELVDEAASRSIEDWSFRELTDEWHRLGELESRLSRLLSHRQESLGAGPVDARRVDSLSLNTYLYDRLDTTFPVLSDATALAERVKVTRRNVLIALTKRA